MHRVVEPHSSNRRFFASVIAIAIAVLTTSGCGVTFRFGRGPARPRRLSAFERCVFDHRLVLRAASASDTKHMVVSGGKSAGQAGVGYTFYRGTRRIDTLRALKLLGDPRLEADYLGLFRREEKRGSILLHTGGTLLGSGMLFGLSGGLMFGFALHQPKDSSSEGAVTRLRAGIALLAVAGAAMLVAPILLGYGYRYARITKSFRTIFIATPAMHSRLREAVATYEAKVVAACRKRVLGGR